MHSRVKSILPLLVAALPWTGCEAGVSIGGLDIQLTAPTEGAMIVDSVPLELKTEASSAVARVEFFDGQTLLGSDTSRPFTLTWEITRDDNGAHTLSAVGYDLAGSSRASVPVHVTLALAGEQGPTGKPGDPTVRFSSPEANSTITVGALNLSVIADDADGIASVELFDGANPLGTDSTSPYSVTWTLTAADNGAHTLTAKAKDTAGNFGTATVNVTVNLPTQGDTTLPTVSLTAPAAGTVFTAPVTAALTANASDNVKVAKVEFLVDGAVESTDATSPYSANWALTAVEVGTHSLTARAWDAAGNSKTSAAISVTVKAATDPGGSGDTPANFRVAFIGDTEAGANFKSVLTLIKNEGAQAVVVAGDMGYANSATTWVAAADSVLGDTFPVFVAEGNHDANGGWSNYPAKLIPRWKAAGATVKETNVADGVFTVTYKGLFMVMLGQGSNKAGYGTFAKAELAASSHTWEACVFHKNMAAMQIGGKGDEQGWESYENCRQGGAIVATGHEHSYERTKTLTSTTNQTVDGSCNDANNVCVGPNRTFVFVSGLGGNSIRDQQRCLPITAPYGCKGEWAKIYASNQNAKYGALFIDFNIDGNPKKARGTFKAVGGAVVDQFTILKD
jgi:hypothetical protein